METIQKQRPEIIKDRAVGVLKVWAKEERSGENFVDAAIIEKLGALIKSMPLEVLDVERKDGKHVAPKKFWGGLVKAS